MKKIENTLSTKKEGKCLYLQGDGNKLFLNITLWLLLGFQCQ